MRENFLLSTVIESKPDYEQKSAPKIYLIEWRWVNNYGGDFMIQNLNTI